MASADEGVGRGADSAVGDATLARLLLAEWSSACVTAAVVAPAIAIFDKAIVLNASGVQTLRSSVREGFSLLLRRPWAFTRQASVRYVWAVYAGTYITANTIDGVCSHFDRSYTLPKFLGTSATNISMMLWKDQAFTRWFGATQSRPLSVSSYMLFGTRDALTMVASFTLPNACARSLHQNLQGALTKNQSTFLAQLLLPCAMQVVSTPLHLTALDLYNRPHRTVTERMIFIRQQYVSALSARIGRILPAYGIGGNVNRTLREWFSSVIM